MSYSSLSDAPILKENTQNFTDSATPTVHDVLAISSLSVPDGDRQVKRRRSNGIFAGTAPPYSETPVSVPGCGQMTTDLPDAAFVKQARTSESPIKLKRAEAWDSEALDIPQSPMAEASNMSTASDGRTVGGSDLINGDFPSTLPRPRHSSSTCREPPRVPELVHRDIVLAEMSLCQRQFMGHYRARLKIAKALATAALKYTAGREGRLAKQKEDEAKRLRQIARNMAANIKQFWKTIEFIVSQRRQSALKEELRDEKETKQAQLVADAEAFSRSISLGLQSWISGIDPLMVHTPMTPLFVPPKGVSENHASSTSASAPEPAGCSPDNLEREGANFEQVDFEETDTDDVEADPDAMPDDAWRAQEQEDAQLDREMSDSSRGSSSLDSDEELALLQEEATMDIDTLKRTFGLGDERDSAPSPPVEPFTPSAMSTHSPPSSTETLLSTTNQDSDTMTFRLRRSRRLRNPFASNTPSETPIPSSGSPLPFTVSPRTVASNASPVNPSQTPTAGDTFTIASRRCSRRGVTQPSDVFTAESQEAPRASAAHTSTSAPSQSMPSLAPSKRGALTRKGARRFQQIRRQSGQKAPLQRKVIEAIPNLCPIPFLLRATLRAYQHEGLTWLLTLHDNKANGILADEMGLGKTIQTIALLAYLACYRGIWGPHLIVVPSSVVLNWETEFHRFLPGFKVLTYYGGRKEREKKRQGWTEAGAFNICIVSYSLAVADAHILKKKAWYYMVLDEAQNIKNYQTQKWQALLNFNTQRRLLLTGTPLQNDLIELWSLMHFLMPALFASHSDWKELFSDPLTQAIDASSVEKEQTLVVRLHSILRPFLLRRLKQDVEGQMPSKYEHTIRCTLTKRQRTLYNEFMQSQATCNCMESSNYFGLLNVLMQASDLLCSSDLRGSFQISDDCLRLFTAHRPLPHSIQLRKICNHPYLLAPREPVTQIKLPQDCRATVTVPRCMQLGLSEPWLVPPEHWWRRMSPRHPILSLADSEVGTWGYRSQSSPSSYRYRHLNIERALLVRHAAQNACLLHPVIRPILANTITSTFRSCSSCTAAQDVLFDTENVKRALNDALLAPNTSQDFGPPPPLLIAASRALTGPKTFQVSSFNSRSQSEADNLPEASAFANTTAYWNACYHHHQFVGSEGQTSLISLSQAQFLPSLSPSQYPSTAHCIPAEVLCLQHPRLLPHSTHWLRLTASRLRSGPLTRPSDSPSHPELDRKLPIRHNPAAAFKKSLFEVARHLHVDPKATLADNGPASAAAQWVHATATALRCIRRAPNLEYLVNYPPSNVNSLLPQSRFPSWYGSAEKSGFKRRRPTISRHLFYAASPPDTTASTLNSPTFPTGLDFVTHRHIWGKEFREWLQTQIGSFKPATVKDQCSALRALYPDSLDDVFKKHASILSHLVCVPEPRIFSQPPRLFFRGTGSAHSCGALEAALTQASHWIARTSEPYHPLMIRKQCIVAPKASLQDDAGKLQYLAGLLCRLHIEKHKCIIFTQMSKMLDILEGFLNLHSYTYVRLDGATKIIQRQRIVETFNTDPRIFVLIASTRAGGVGLNLTGADTVIFYDTDWNPAMDRQAMDRCHRIGQTRDVHVYRLITEFTIEENILRKQLLKRMLDDVVVDQGRFTTEKASSSFLTQSEVKQMFTPSTDATDLYKTRILHESSCSGASEGLSVLQTPYDVVLPPPSEDNIPAALFQKKIQEIEDDESVPTTVSVHADDNMTSGSVPFGDDTLLLHSSSGVDGVGSDSARSLYDSCSILNQTLLSFAPRKDASGNLTVPPPSLDRPFWLLPPCEDPELSALTNASGSPQGSPKQLQNYGNIKKVSISDTTSVYVSRVVSLAIRMLEKNPTPTLIADTAAIQHRIAMFKLGANPD